MLILSTKLKNAIGHYANDMTLTYTLRTISRNGFKKGCSGFICNTDNNAVVYVDTEEPCLTSLHYMYRYADNEKDYIGYHNRWANTLDELAREVSKLLEIPVKETNDYRI